MTSGPRPSPLLAVKQTIPPVPPGLVRRSRLEERLDSTRARLTLVVAPAGSGKTSLLGRWAAAASDQEAVAWLSIDESDDEPIRFWSYVLTALGRTSEAISPSPLEALPASGGGPMAHALPLLLNELAATTTQHVLVLDDFHLITHREIHESLEFLVSHLPPTLRIVMGTRVDPPLPLARMRVRGELAELRAEDLRFTVGESAALLEAVSSTELTPGAASAACEQTEGWAAGLQLAGLALRQGPGSDVLAADQRHVFDYFEQEVLPALAPAQRELLRRAAPLELLSGSLCDAVLGVDGSAAVLAELERARLFVVAYDRDREWYRCHRLLRDALLQDASTGPDGGSRGVLRRAALWFEEHGRIDDAVRHLLAAGDAEEAARLLTSGFRWFLDRGWAATYLARGEQLPEGAVQAPLAISLAYAADLTGDREAVVRWLDLAEPRVDGDTVVVGWRSPRAGIHALRGVFGTPASEPAVAVDLCERALALETAAGSMEHPEARAALGRAYGLAGRFQEGVEILSDSWRRRAERDWSTERLLQVGGLLGLFRLGLGSDLESDRLLAEVGALADEAERDWTPAAAAPVAALIRLLEGRQAFLSGDLVRARAQLDAGVGLADLSARPTYVVLGLVFRAELELATRERDAARASLLRARELVDNDPVTPFVHEWLVDAETRVGRVAARSATDTGAMFEELTDRELSILRMLPGTATQREIGAALFLSINTVKAYNKSLYRKLGVGSRQDAVSAARRLGLL